MLHPEVLEHHICEAFTNDKMEAKITEMMENECQFTELIAIIYTHGFLAGMERGKNNN